MKTPYRLSKDYDVLYKLLTGDFIAVGFVDYRFHGEDESIPASRDVVKIRRNKEYDISISARGIQYGGVDRYFKGLQKTERQLFVEDCERMNLEWIDGHSMPEKSQVV